MIEFFLYERQQRVVLNGRESEWLTIIAILRQGLVLGPLYFLICINDLSDNLDSNVKLFTDDKKRFDKVGLWVNNGKCSSIQIHQNKLKRFFFSRKIKKVYQPPLLFNNSTFQQISTQKHLGKHLDEELTYKHHINEKINKGNKGIGIIRNYSVVRRLKQTEHRHLLLSGKSLLSFIKLT